MWRLRHGRHRDCTCSRNTVFPQRPGLYDGVPGEGKLCFVRILPLDRKSTRLNSSHVAISYAVFCLNHPVPTWIFTLSLHDALPILDERERYFLKKPGAETDMNVATPAWTTPRLHVFA